MHLGRISTSSTAGRGLDSYRGRNPFFGLSKMKSGIGHHDLNYVQEGLREFFDVCC